MKWMFDKGSMARSKRTGVRAEILTEGGTEVNIQPFKHTETGQDGYWITSQKANFKGNLEERYLWINMHPVEIYRYFSTRPALGTTAPVVRWESWSPITKTRVDDFVMQHGSFVELEFPMAFLGGEPPNLKVAPGLDFAMVWWRGLPAESGGKFAPRFMMYWADKAGTVDKDADNNKLWVSWETF